MKTCSRLCSFLLGIACVAVLCLSGCGSAAPKPTPPPISPHPSSASSGNIAWPSWAKDNPRPGADHAVAYACWDDRVVFVLWTDFDTTGGGTSGPTLEGVYRAFLIAEGGTQVECDCRTSDGRSGTLNVHVDRKAISQTPYDLDNGNVFLVSTRGDSPQVTQLKREAWDLGVEGAGEEVKARLAKLAETDDEITKFLTRESEPAESPE